MTTATDPPAGIVRGSQAGIEDAIRDQTTTLAAGIIAGGSVETTVTPAAVTLVAATAKTLLAANASRVRAVFFNPLATPLFVRKATLAGSPATAAAGGYDFVVAAGGMWTSDPKEYAGAYNGICATAGDVNVSESV